MSEETNNNEKPNTFEVGKFYRICSNPVYPYSTKTEIPHLVVRKTKTKIVFEHLFKTHDGGLAKFSQRFSLFKEQDGSESAHSTEKWSMIPIMYPDKPCDKPSVWDSVSSRV